MTDINRLRSLSRFIRNQASLTDERKPMPGPGEVRLNNEAAMLIAEVLDEYVQEHGNADSPRWNYLTLAEFYRRHGFISKTTPMCLLCRHTPISWPPPLQHPELPNIVICDACLAG